MLSMDKLFSFKKKDYGVQSWIFLGPFFIVLTLFLSLFSTISNKDLFLLSAVGLVLCWNKKEKGLFYSMLFLGVLMVIKHVQITSDHMWQFGIECSLGLGFVIAYYSMEYISEFISSTTVSREDILKDVDEMQEKLKKEEDFHQRQHKNFKYEMDRLSLQLKEKTDEIVEFKNKVESLRDAVSEKSQEKESLFEEVKKRENKINILSQEIADMKDYILSIQDNEELFKRNKFILNELNIARVEKEQANAINESLAKMLSKEISLKKDFESQNKELTERLEELSFKFNKVNEEPNLTDEELLHRYEEKYLEIKKYESLYKQLKNQFEEKKQLLDQTRKELFGSREQLNALQRERQMRENDESLAVKKLYSQINEFEKEFSKMEEENNSLQSIISKLMKTSLQES